MQRPDHAHVAHVAFVPGEFGSTIGDGPAQLGLPELPDGHAVRPVARHADADGYSFAGCSRRWSFAP